MVRPAAGGRRGRYGTAGAAEAQGPRVHAPAPSALTILSAYTSSATEPYRMVVAMSARPASRCRWALHPALPAAGPEAIRAALWHAAGLKMVEASEEGLDLFALDGEALAPMWCGEAYKAEAA